MEPMDDVRSAIKTNLWHQKAVIATIAPERWCSKPPYKDMHDCVHVCVDPQGNLSAVKWELKYVNQSPL